MYLEQRIEAIEGQVSKLIKLVEELTATPTAQAVPVPATKQKVSPPKAETAVAEVHTAESLQGRCLALVRKDLSNKTIIKDLLAGYNVKLLKDLNPEQLAEVAEVIANLESA